MFYLTVFAAMIWEHLSGARSTDRDFEMRVPRSSPAWRPPAALFVLAIVGLYAIQLAVISWAAAAQPAQPIKLPLALLDDRGVDVYSRSREIASLAVLAIVALQTVALLGLWRRLRRGISSRTLASIAAGVAALLGLSLTSPVLLSADLYLYSGYAILGAQAYSPPAAPFTGNASVINDWWGTPLLPAPYGPLFLLYVHGLLQFIPSLWIKLEVLRLSNVAWFLAMIWLLQRIGVPGRTLAVVALNPALALIFIANGHNDLVGVTLLVGAFALAEARPSISALLVVAASLIKIPLALVALPILVRSRAKRRVTLATITLLLSGLAALIFGGPPYFHALHEDFVTHVITTPFVHAIAAVVAAAVLLVMFFRRGSLLSAAFILPSLAARQFPWYVLWGMPYALAGDRLAGFLILFPAAAYLTETCFDARIPKLAVALLFSVAAIRALGWRKRTSTASATLPAQAG